MRGGVDCNAAVADRHAESVDQRLAATEATCAEPCSSAPHKLQKYLERKGRESTLPLVALAENWAREGEREFKGFGKKEAEESCKVTWREKKI